LGGGLREHSFGETVFAFTYFVLLNASACLLVAAKMIKSYSLVKRRVGLLRNERLMAELQLLKSQVHPHFLFNTLNNLQSLIIQRSDQAAEMAQRLHALTKYIMVECKKEEIPLQNEIAILRDYIGLQKVRYDERLSVAFRVHGDIDGLSISPLLLMPLLENSFKHGVSRQVNDCWIRLDIHCEKKGLCVQVSNSREEAVRAQDYTGGIGLQNIRKRLDLLYEKDYDLAIAPEKDSFTVTLQLNHA
jgi:LytS/YehU family sensor histidine kinase